MGDVTPDRENNTSKDTEADRASVLRKKAKREVRWSRGPERGWHGLEVSPGSLVRPAMAHNCLSLIMGSTHSRS